MRFFALRKLSSCRYRCEIRPDHPAHTMIMSKSVGTRTVSEQVESFSPESGNWHGALYHGSVARRDEVIIGVG